MTNIYIAFVAAFLLPLLFHSWRVAVISLGIQGILMGLILLYTHERSASMALEAINLFVVRGVVVPWILFRAMKNVPMPPDFTLIRKSVLQWLIAFALVGLAFTFGWKMSLKNPLEAIQLGTATAAILLSMHVLANQSHPLAQVVGLLTFEGGITLIELLSPHAMPLYAFVGVSLVYVVLILTCAHYLPLLAISAHGVNAEDEVFL